MQIDEAAVRANFEMLSTQELAQLAGQETLTPEAAAILAEVLGERGRSTGSAAEGAAGTTELAMPNQRSWRRYLLEHFDGQRPLWSAFWVVGALGFVALFVLLVILAEISRPAIAGVSVMFGLARLGLVIAFGVLALASIWRCAYNVNWKVWGHLARAFVIALGAVPISIAVVSAIYY